MSDSNAPAPPPPASSSSPAKWIAIALLGAAVGGTVVWFATRNKEAPTTGSGVVVPSGKQAAVEGLPEHTEPLQGTLPSEAPVPAMILEVRAPEKLRAAIQGNDWAQEALKAPLGRGFLGSWAAFLGTRGEDIGGPFVGTVLEYVTQELLATPFRVVWFGGDGAPNTPAIITAVNDKTDAAFAALDHIAKKGAVKFDHCSGEDSGDANAMMVSRWLIADHAVFAAKRGKVYAFGRQAEAVAQGLCTKVEEAKAEKGVDLELRLRPAGLGRETEELALFTGLGDEARLQFGLEGNTLVPRGIAAASAMEERLDGEALPEALLKAIPEEMPVVLSLALKLPKQLTAEALANHVGGKKSETMTRHLALVWVPHADGSGVDTALLWGRGEDRPELEQAFTGTWADACGLPIYASRPALVERIRTTCAGKTPSLLNAAPAVAEGLRAKSSVLLGVHVGRVLAGVTTEAYVTETKAKKLPPEIEEARRLLESLPFVGLRGLVKGDALVPAGFRS